MVGKSVFIGRFAGPLRPITPLLAGILKMPSISFLLTSILSAMAYVIIYFSPGLLIGVSSLLMGHMGMSHLMLWFFALLAAGSSLLYSLFNRAVLDRHWQSFLNRIWLSIATHRFSKILKNPNDRQNPHQLGLLLLIVFTLFVTLIFTYSVHRHGWAIHLNQAIFHGLRTLRNLHTDWIMLAVTNTADTHVMMFLLLGLFFWFVGQREYNLAAHTVLLGALGIGSILLLKHGLHFPRPMGNVFTKTTGSYPSGHTGLTFTVLGFVITLVSLHQPRYRSTLLSFFVIIITLVGLSRLYLGDHWLSDIIGAIFIGMLCVAYTMLSYRRSTLTHLKVNSLLSAFLMLWLSVSVAFFTVQHEKQLQQHQLLWPHETQTQTQWLNQASRPQYQNPFGQPLGYFNLQWLSSRKNIRSTLEHKGWQSRGTHRFNQLGKKTHRPTLPPLFNDHGPVMQWVKVVGDHVYQLQLWRSGIHVAQHTGDAIPVYYGLVSNFMPLQRDLGRAAILKAGNKQLFLTS